jgi:hypothetical protein
LESNQLATVPNVLVRMLRNDSSPLSAVRLVGNPAVPPAPFHEHLRWANLSGSACPVSKYLDSAAYGYTCGARCLATPTQGVIELSNTSSGRLASNSAVRRRLPSDAQARNPGNSSHVITYGHNQYCRWHLRAPPGHIVAGRFAKISLYMINYNAVVYDTRGDTPAVYLDEDAVRCGDSVRIYDGDSDLVTQRVATVSASLTLEWAVLVALAVSIGATSRHAHRGRVLRSVASLKPVARRRPGPDSW